MWEGGEVEQARSLFPAILSFFIHPSFFVRSGRPSFCLAEDFALLFQAPGRGVGGLKHEELKQDEANLALSGGGTSRSSSFPSLTGGA